MNNKLIQTLIAVLLFVLCIFFISTGIWIILDARTMYQESLKPLASDIKPRYETFKEGYDLAYTFFIIGAGTLIMLLLLPRLQSISFGGLSINLKEVQARLDALTEQQNKLQQFTNLEGGGKGVTPEIYSKIQDTSNKIRNEDIKPKLKPKVKYPNDPQKGMWGGKSYSRTRELTAMITESTIPELFEVKIIVRSTDKNDPLVGVVRFYLHDTFRNQNPVITAQNNKAELDLKMVWGAFTVGVEADGGITRLELDMAELPDAPKLFKDR